MPETSPKNKQKKANPSSIGLTERGDGEEKAVDVAIVGGGLSGLTLGILLARSGISTLCIDQDDPENQVQESFDGRTMAISAGSQRVLESAGLWTLVENKACPIREIAIYDNGPPRRLTFHSEDAGGETFGWIVEIRDLRASLFDLAARTPGLTHLAPARVARIEVNSTRSDGGTEEIKNAAIFLKGQKDGVQQKIRTRLVVGADGRGSFTRKSAGIGTRGWSYHQTAIVCTVEHEHPHRNMAVEDFRPDGPFAILPMCDGPDGEHRSSIVWTRHKASFGLYDGAAKSPMDFDDRTFDIAISTLFPAEYGAVRRVGKRFSYPLTLLHAKTYIAPRRVLVADAAHGIHPIAGQGLNLGLRDVAALCDAIVRAHKNGQDIGSIEVLKAYERSRRMDNMIMAGATDLLNLLFSNDLGPVRLARRVGLAAVSRLPFVKRFFVSQAMGTAGIVPEIMQKSR